MSAGVSFCGPRRCIVQCLHTNVCSGSDLAEVVESGRIEGKVRRVTRQDPGF